MARNPWLALVMSMIPVVNFYILYKWWEELKAATKADYDPIIRVVLMLVPFVNIYFLWKLFSDVEKAAIAKGKAGFMFGATVMYVLSFLLLGIPFLYMFYKTQDLLNAIE
ncbi:MAG: hypothetical protein NTY83_02285 [Candidatus Micrarchaeota archaeon]|nr:hypothetical protein [Candidatus Micrarchaeota archaeon]